MNANLRLLIGIVLAAALASCAAPPKPAPSPPPPRPFVTPGLPEPLPPKQPADWRDAPASPGNWYWRKEGNRSIAFFTSDPKMPSYGGFWLVCDPAARQVELRFTSPKLDDTIMTVVTTSMQKTLPAKRSGWEVVAVVPANDPLLDAMAFSRGRFMVTVLHDTPRYLPAWPEVSRVIEDCR